MASVLRIEEASTALGFRLAGPHGSVAVTEIAAGVVFLDFEGIAYSAFTERIEEALDGAIARSGELTVFADAWRMRVYETEFRRKWTVWLQSHRDAIRSCVVLARSPMARMWIDIVNVVTGGLVYSVEDRALLRRLVHETVFEGARPGSAMAPVPWTALPI